MPPRSKKFDPRLLGTWKSDRRRTFQHYKPKASCPPSSFRKFKTLFGKLVITWGQGEYITELNGNRSKANYEVIAKDSSSVMIRYYDGFDTVGVLRQIFFLGEYYCMPISGGSLVEYFRRVPEADRGDFCNH